MAMLEEVPQAEDLVELTPRPGFVVKTKLEDATLNPPREKGTKVFINICSEDQVPLPEVEYDPKVIYPLIMDNMWEIPIVTSDLREVTDKKGNLAYVYDCIINTRSMRWIQMDKELREILIEWTLESVEIRSDIVLSRESIATPKMASKGAIPPLEILKSDMDIKRLNREFEERVQKLENDPLSIIEARRYEDDLKEDIDGDVDIFNVNNTSGRSSTKPLIQEIGNMSINTSKKKLEAPKVAKPAITQIAVNEKPVLKYDTVIHKVDVNGYKLKVEIKSQNKSSLDYELGLDKSKNSLMLKNLNPNFTTKKDLELPLPSVFEKPSFKSFFIYKESKLVIFIK